MGEGNFAVVPTSFLDGGKVSHFLPPCGAPVSESSICSHSISDSLTLVAETRGWHDQCPCHEIEPMLAECLKSGGDAVHVSTFADRLYIAVMRNNRLVMANRFTTNCDEDTLYHILAAYRAYDLDRHTHPLFVHGGMKSNHIKKFIAKCV